MSEENFNSRKISPSRVNKYLTCGVQFRRYYIDKEPPKLSGSAALFGNVIHKALEKWSLDRSQSLVSLTAQAWMTETRKDGKDTVVTRFIREYQAISIEVMRAEKAAAESFEARNKGKVSKAPRMTKEFKESDAAKKLNRLLGQWIPKLNADSPWRFTEYDPLPNLYDESLKVAKRYAQKWSHLPKSIHTEFEFTVEWEGFVLTGFVDNIEPVIDGDELVELQIVDYKTYAKVPPLQKDWRQGAIYQVAVNHLRSTGQLPIPESVPVRIVFDYPRLLLRRDFVYGPEDIALLKDELEMYSRAVDAEVFLPANKSQNPDFCDYPEDCCLRFKGAGCGTRGALYPEEEAA